MKERQSTYNIQEASLGFESEVERLKLQATMGWTKEFRNLQLYGLENGMRIIELGSGPGFVTEQLVNSLPDSQITALEIDETLLNKAKKLLDNVPLSRLQFVQSSVYDTGLPDQSFDFAIARLLFLHLHNPLLAAQEIYRVLKPGGKLVIIDVDDGIFGAFNPDIHALPSVLKKVADYVAEKGGNRHIGRSLPRLLKNAGYIDVDIDAIIQHSDILGIEGFKRRLDINRFAVFFKNGIINKQEYDQLEEASHQINNSAEAYAMMTSITACGKKPELQ
ncbi:2-methoxy-6-polyprenyl-1,4-benzoquinol methylase, mitochondrial [Paenibacillus allorhizoplanae]|uniref:2-methoxy-6-polyprenyl-1,4-benzoquinol methylase, mitochondrial n=1 Tax=Paenibacillus allorhizoplanae TaxID=2905648 RepID=A0ABM9C2B6_9BACL|nr:methyltransferase domain-containing protein [Paenibacillus allorhizoplanae]CAH1200368.1 2-methoxy-6-polyprenyl-1,4-benzoquinol methylase, mitochondrial [Paenibacillus allorhizoplanae]